jgi:hypothetical protein
MITRDTAKDMTDGQLAGDRIDILDEEQTIVLARAAPIR